MASAPLTAADEARLAHRVLRLRENGVDSERQIKAFADAELLRRTANPEEFERSAGKLQASAVGPAALSGLALAVRNVLEPGAPGPTDRKAVEKMFAYDGLSDVWRAWRAGVEAHRDNHDQAQVKAVEKAEALAQQKHDDTVARMLESGDEWPVHPYFGHQRHEAGAANALYDLGRQGFLSGIVDWDTAVIKAALVDSADYTVNLATHEFLSSVLAAGREETSPAFTTKTVAAGVADADDITFTAAAGDPVEAIIIYQASAVTGGADVADTAQRLIAYIDTVTPAFPLTLNGGNVTVTWDSGANRIFKL